MEEIIIQYLRKKGLLSSKAEKFIISGKFGVFTLNELLDDFSSNISLDFIDWLMTNCQLSDDQTIWSYNSEDYSLEGIYNVFINESQSTTDLGTSYKDFESKTQKQQ